MGATLILDTSSGRLPGGGREVAATVAETDVSAGDIIRISISGLAVLHGITAQLRLPFVACPVEAASGEPDLLPHLLEGPSAGGI
jgi:hypothetical protein